MARLMAAEVRIFLDKWRLNVLTSLVESYTFVCGRDVTGSKIFHERNIRFHS